MKKELMEISKEEKELERFYRWINIINEEIEKFVATKNIEKTQEILNIKKELLESYYIKDKKLTNEIEDNLISYFL